MKARLCLISLAFVIVLAACSSSGAPAGEREAGQSAAQNAVAVADESAIVIVDNDLGQIFTYIPMGVHETIPPIEGTTAGTRCLSVFGTVEIQPLGDDGALAGALTAPLLENVTVEGDRVGQRMSCIGVLEELSPLGYFPLDEIEVVVGATVGFYMSYGDSEGEIESLVAQSWTNSSGSVPVGVAAPQALVLSEPTTEIVAEPLAGAEYRYGDFWTVRPQQIVELTGGAEEMQCYAATVIASVAPYETDGLPDWSDGATELGMLVNGAYLDNLGVRTNIEQSTWQFSRDASEYPQPPLCDTNPLTAVGWQPRPATIEFDTEVAYFEVLLAPTWLEPEQLVIGEAWLPSSYGIFGFDVTTEIEPPPGS